MKNSSLFIFLSCGLFDYFYEESREFWVNSLWKEKKWLVSTRKERTRLRKSVLETPWQLCRKRKLFFVRVCVIKFPVLVKQYSAKNSLSSQKPPLQESRFWRINIPSEWQHCCSLPACIYYLEILNLSLSLSMREWMNGRASSSRLLTAQGSNYYVLVASEMLDLTLTEHKIIGSIWLLF